MAVLGRLKIAPNQRLDLPDVQAFDAFSAGDWQNFLLGMTGGRPLILSGFEVFQPNTLIGNPAGTCDITLDSAMLWWPDGSEGSFYSSLSGVDPRSVTLITAATNYIEMTFTLTSAAQDARALWDPGANGGAGGEFSQVVDTEFVLDVVITRNNTGFSDGATPIAQVVVDGSNNVTSITDCRPLLFRLGTGGTSPDPTSSFSWPNVPLGYARTDTGVTMTSPSDPNAFQGADKNIKNLKDWMDAVMTRIKEIAGAPRWFTPSSSSGGGNLSLAELFLDSEAGHSYIPNRSVRIAWSQNSDSFLRSVDAVGIHQAVSWKATFGQLQWSLGGTFQSSNNRAYLNYLFSANVPTGQNLYLHLQRDVTINGGPLVAFQNVNGTTGAVTSAGTGAFTGIAVGDFVRKASGTTYQYYQVVELRVNLTTPFTNGTVQGTVADGTVQYLVINTHDGPIVASTEQYFYFRQQYQNSDLVVSQYGQFDASYYWIGANIGGMFYLRYYGDLQPGEETEVMNDSDSQRFAGGGGADLMLLQSENAVYDGTNGYSLKTGSGTLLTLVRRLADNTVGNPSNSDNSGASPSYTIAAPVGTMNDGDGLWVRLSDSTSGALTSGTVTNVNTDNVYQVLPQAQNPLRIYENMNVFLVARKYTINGVPTLIFVNGEWLSPDGKWINNSLSIQQDLFLKNKTQWSIPFISTTGGKVDENNAQLFWNNAGGNDGDGELGVRNFRITEDSVNHIDYIFQATPQDVSLFGNIGAHTITFGQNNTTTVFPGSIVVQGTSSTVASESLLVTNKQIALGVGNINNGGGDSGIAVADNTVSPSTFSSTSGQDYIDVVYGSAHGYTVGQLLWIETATACGGITAGQISGPYTIAASGTVVDTAVIVNSTTIRLFTDGTATSTQTQTVGGSVTFVSFLTPSNILLSNSSGNTTGMTSWMFQVKGVATTPTLTPVASYGIVPTANTTNFVGGRIPFANADGQGPSAGATTLNFSANLSWDNGTNTLTVGGNTSFAGDLDPSTDNSYELGDFNLRWQDVHLGPLGAIVHNDATNTNYASLAFSGATAKLSTDAATSLNIATGANPGISMDTSGRLGIFASTATTSALNITQTSVITSGTTQMGIFLSTLLTGTTTSHNVHVAGQISTVTAATAAGVHIANMTTTAGGAITTQYGLLLDDYSTGATANYGIYSIATSGTGKWFIYGSSTATSFFGGGVGFGNSTQATINNQRVLIGVNTDTTAAGGISFGGDTTLYRLNTNSLATGGALTVGGNILPSTDNSFTVGSTAARFSAEHVGPAGFVSHNDATNTAKVTLGFTSTTATLASDAASALAIGVGTATAIQLDTSNRMGIGSAANTSSHVAYAGTNPATGVSTNSLLISETQSTAAVTSMAGASVQIAVPATGSPTTFTAAYVFQVLNASIGANSTLTNQYGLYINALSGATNNYGVYGNTTAGSGKWFIFGAGGATSAFSGGVGIGNTTQATINNQRLLIGVNTDTTAAGGISFGGDTTQYRQAANVLAFGASLYPTVDNTYDLGAAGQRWRNVYAVGVVATGAVQLNYGTTQTSNYSATATDNFIPVNTSTGTVTITLPAVSSSNKGQWIIVKDVGGFITQTGKQIIVAPSGANTIDGTNSSVTIDFNAYSALEFVSDGVSNWSVI